MKTENAPVAEFELPHQDLKDLQAIGFQKTLRTDAGRRTTPEAERPTAPPTPLPKRPKGRLFVGAILLAVCGAAAFGVWNAFFRYQAYGVVDGRSIEIVAPWSGTIQQLQAFEGKPVRRGEVLLTLDNLQLRQEIERVGDSLRLAQATLEAEISKLRWQSQVSRGHASRSRADYFTLWGTLLQEQAELNRLSGELEREEYVRSRGVGSKSNLDRLAFDKLGQEKKVEKLKIAVEELKQQSDFSRFVDDDGYDQLKPNFVRIETLRSELARLRERMELGQVRAPVDGFVIRRLHENGEHVSASDAILEIVEEGTIETVLYMPQQHSQALQVGQEVTLTMAPYPDPVVGRVTRLAERFEPAPPSISRFYNSGQQLLPVYLQPIAEHERWMALRVGAVVQLPAASPIETLTRSNSLDRESERANP